MSIPRWIHRRVPNLVPFGPSVWYLTQTYICDPLKPRNAPCGIEGRIVFSYVLSQTTPQTCTKFGANRSSRLTASPDIWICDPLKPHKMPPGVLWGDLHLAYVQSVQLFDSFSRVLNVWPPKTPKCLEEHFVWRISIPRWICTCVQNLVPIGAAVSFDSFNRLEFVTPLPPKMPPGILMGELYSAYVHSQTNPQTCTKFGANRSSCLTASPDFWICDPLKTSEMPLGYCGANCI